MKRIEYTLPIEWVRGNISGRQQLTYYDGRAAYYSPDGEKTTAGNYQARLIAKVMNCQTLKQKKYFQVRTKTSVNMTTTMKRNLALMGGTGALFASLISNKSSAIYLACVVAKPMRMTLRAFITPIIRAGLAAKDEHIIIAYGVYIVNPWTSEETPNVQISTDVLDKFRSVLANS